MFFTYLKRELRRRAKQAIVVAVGLAVGIGLVVAVSAISSGVKDAQGQVLHSLYGVGTDMTVTVPVTPANVGPQRFGGFGNGTGPNATTARPAAGATGGASSGTGGRHIARNTLRPGFGSTTIAESEVAAVAHLSGAAGTVGSLTLNDTSFSGTIPTFSAGQRPAAGSTGSGPAFTISTFSVDGVEITSTDVGPLTASEITKGRYFTAGQSTADVAIVSAAYAKAHSLAVGGTVTVGGTSCGIVGVASVPSGSADVFLPLGTAQSLSNESGKVTTIYARATSASSVATLASEVKAAIPKATVATSASLAKEVTGSLTSASNLATNLGKWLSIVALVVAVALAGLLMMAAVSRRVREFGTLKAIGWRSRRIVGQVMGEGLVLGVLGGAVGIGLGAIASVVVSAVSPTLSATVGSAASAAQLPATGRFGGGGGGFFRAGGPGGGGPGGFRQAGSATHTVLVHLSAPLQGTTIALAVGLAIAGGLVAGGLGSWRAARLRPATALRRVE